MNWSINTKSAFLKSVMLLSTGTLIAQLISYIATPFITRLFTPEELGTLGWFMRIATFLATAATIRYELALPIPKKDEHAFQLLRSTFKIASYIILSFFLITIIYWLFNQTDTSFWFLALISVAGIFIVIKNIGTNWSIRMRYFKAISTSAIVAAIFTNVSKIIAGKLELSSKGLIWATIIGLFAGAIVFIIQIQNFKKKSHHQYSSKKAKALRINHKDFPFVNLPHTLIDHGREVILAYFLILFFDEAVFGSYEQAFRLLKIPLILIGTSIGQVFFNRISELYKEKKGMIQSLFKTTVLLTAISIVPFAIIFLYGDIIFEFVLGEQWFYAGQIAQALTPWLLVNFIASPLSTLPLVLKKQKIFFWIGLVGTIIQLIGFGLIPYLYQFTDDETLILFKIISWSMGFYLVLVMIFKFKIVQNYESRIG